VLSQDDLRQDEDLEATGGQQSDNEKYDDIPEYYKQEIMATYKNLYWSRIISISQFDEEANKRWPMGTDIIHELEELAEV